MLANFITFTIAREKV